MRTVDGRTRKTLASQELDGIPLPNCWQVIRLRRKRISHRDGSVTIFSDRPGDDPLDRTSRWATMKSSPPRNAADGEGRGAVASSGGFGGSIASALRGPCRPAWVLLKCEEPQASCSCRPWKRESKNCLKKERCVL